MNFAKGRVRGGMRWIAWRINTLQEAFRDSELLIDGGRFEGLKRHPVVN